MGIQSGSGSAITSVPGSFFESSNYSGSNCSVKSREGTSSSKSSNHYEDQKVKEIYEERNELLNAKFNYIYIGIEPIGTKIGHAISNNIVMTGIKNLLPTYLGGSTFTFHASCFLGLQYFGIGEGVLLEYGGYCGGDPSYKNKYIHYAQEDGMRFIKMEFKEYEKKIHNGLKGSQIIEHLNIKNNMSLQELIDKCISTSKKNWRKKDYNLSTYNCQDFIAKVIEVLFVERDFKEKTSFRHNYALSIYPPVIVKALEKNENNGFVTGAESVPLFGPLIEIITSKLSD